MLRQKYYLGLVRGTHFKIKLKASDSQDARNKVARYFQRDYPNKSLQDILVSVSVSEMTEYRYRK